MSQQLQTVVPSSAFLFFFSININIFVFTCCLERSSIVFTVSPFPVKVPTGGEERMKVFPTFVSQDFELKGRGLDTAVTDIKLSSAGTAL